MNNKKITWIYILQGIGIGVIAILLKCLVSFAVLLYYSGENLVGDLPNYILNIVSFVASLLVYNSVYGIFLSFDRSAAEEFIVREDGSKGFKKIFGYKSFITKAIAAIAFTSVAAALGCAKEIAGMFYLGDGVSPYSNGIVPFSATLFISAFLILFNRYEAVRYWTVLERQGTLYETVNIKKLLIRFIVIAVAYPLTLPLLPLIAFVFISLFATAAAVITAPVLLLIIILLIASLFGLKILLVIKRRKSFIKNTATVVRQHGFSLSEIQNPYSSLFSTKKQCIFTVTNKKTTYDCLVLGQVFKSVPICFTSDSEGYYRYRLGTKRHNITLEKHFTFTTDGSGVKILIINPTPKYAYICDVESDKEKRLFNADKLWNYVVYEAEAFVGALDRDCLGKYSSVAENNDVKVPRLPNVHL